MSAEKLSPEEQQRQRYERLESEADAIKGESLASDAWKRLRRKPVAMLSLIILVVLGLLAVFTPLLPLQAPLKVDISRKLMPPNLKPASIDPQTVEVQFGEQLFFNRWMINARIFLFGEWAIPSIAGTDNQGRDLFARLFWGARVSLMVGLVATLVSLVIGVSYGAISGYVGGVVDDAMMRIVDVLYSVPFIFVVIFLLTILGEKSIKDRLAEFGVNQLTVFFLLVGAIYWLTMARVVRGQVMSLKNDQFIEAARTIGAGRMRIVFLHLIPNLLSVVIVYLTLTIPRVMLFEAFLSFLGLGVQPPNVSWGLLASGGYQMITSVKIFWWLITFPGVALGVTLFALNFLGDGLRDALDPRLKNR